MMAQIEKRTLAEIAASPNQETRWLYALYLRGGEPDTEHEEWVKAAAEMGVVPAMYGYAEHLEFSDRPDEAEEWYFAAADRGFAAAVYMVALIYDERGEFSTSEQYYREAAERWFVPAMYDLGRILASRDDAEALFWYVLSEQEHYEPWDA